MPAPYIAIPGAATRPGIPPRFYTIKSLYSISPEAAHAEIPPTLKRWLQSDRISPMLNALRSIFPVIFMIGLGFVLTKKKWFEGESSALISRLVLNIALPAFMVSNLLSGYDKEKLLSMLPGLPVPFVGIWVSFSIAVLLGRIFKVQKNRRGVFACMFTLSNGVFIGVPLNLILFGDASLPYSLFYYIANTTTLWTIGSYGI
ncbi:MAG TPA: hypothetical protein DIT55_09005, partial [Spirochaetaceae bacterium]|nr:hypothetical protein [Spirochaetaceae bacterium]